MFILFNINAFFLFCCSMKESIKVLLLANKSVKNDDDVHAVRASLYCVTCINDFITSCPDKLALCGKIVLWLLSVYNLFSI